MKYLIICFFLFTDFYNMHILKSLYIYLRESWFSNKNKWSKKKNETNEIRNLSIIKKKKKVHLLN